MGGKILVGMVMKAKVGDLGEEVREVFYRRLRKELTRMFQRVSGKKRFLVRFQYGCEKDLNSNKLTAVAVEKNPVDEEPKVPTIASVPENAVDLEKG